MSTRNRDRRSVRGGIACVAGVAVLLAAAPLAAQQGAPEREHTVRRGDTLWDLARAYFSNPFLWPVIYDANRAVVSNPHRIYPAERLVIPGVTANGVAAGGLPGAAGMAPDAAWVQPEPTRFLRAPGGASARALDGLEETVRPLVRAAEYRSTPWLASGETVGVRARVARLVDPAGVSDRMPTMLQPRDRVYLEALAGPAPVAGDSLLIVRIGRAIGGHGQVVQPLGMLHVDSVPDGVPSATLVRQFGDARIGDVIVTPGAVPVLPTVHHGEAGDGAQRGVLLEFVTEHAMYGAADYGFIDLGRAQGVAVGDELSVYVPPPPADVRLPATAVATVRVIRVEGNSATVRVVGVNTTALAPGLPVRLVRRAS